MGLLLSKIVFQPPQHQTYTIDDPHPCVSLSLPNNKLTYGMYFKSPNSHEKRVILYSHGNGQDMGKCVEFMRNLVRYTQLNVFMYDYLGYGITKHEEQPSEEGVYMCAEAAIKYLLNDRQFPQENIILYGTSLGTAASIYLATRYTKVNGMILESPLLSIMRTQTSLFALRNFDMFESYMRIGAVQCVCFVLHGTDDALVPFTNGVEIYNAAKHKYPPKWVVGAGHNNLRSTMGHDNFLEAITEFVIDLGLRSAVAERRYSKVAATDASESPTDAEEAAASPSSSTEATTSSQQQPPEEGKTNSSLSIEEKYLQIIEFTKK